MALSRKDISNLTIGAQDGFSGTAAINEATPAATDTTFDIDTLSLVSGIKIVPVGARFKTGSITTLREITASNNSQVWTLTIDATGGTYDLILNGETAAAIAEDATASAVQAALVALASVTAGDVTVTGSDGGPYTITLAGTLANTSGNTLTTVATSLTGGAGTATVASVQDGLSTWNLTFTPAITAGSVPSDDDVITFWPSRLTIEIGEGGFSFSSPTPRSFDRNRNKLDGVRNAPEEPMTVSTQFIFDQLRASGGQKITLFEALYQQGEAKNWVTSALLPCDPYCLDLFIIDDQNCGSEEAEVYYFRRFYVTSIGGAFEDAQVTLEGECNSKLPEVTRVATTGTALTDIK